MAHRTLLVLALVLSVSGTPAMSQCVFHNIQCGQTVNSNLTTDDCLDDGKFGDVFSFPGQAGQTVTIDLSSNAFDTALLLLNPVTDELVEDDDSGPGRNSRIVHTLDVTSQEWLIGATSYLSNQTGPYTLSLQCSGQPPPPTCPSGTFTDPNYPDFCFQVTIGNPGSTIPGVREPDCLPETVCVSGAVPGRSEVFLRILGPRPNGYLWPTIVRFTPSRLVVDILQPIADSTAQGKEYVLPAVPPGTDELPGLQDRFGFWP